MKDYNKEIRNLTEAVNNLYADNLNEQTGYEHLFWDWFIQYNLQKKLGDVLGKEVFLAWVEAGRPGNIEDFATKYVKDKLEELIPDWLKPDEPVDDDDDDDDITPSRPDKPTVPVDPPGPGGGRYPTSPQLP